MPWSRKFDEPIELADTSIRTLRDAADYVMGLPSAQQRKPHWQIAGTHLIYAAERSLGWVWLARIAMLRALNHSDGPKVFRRRKKLVKANKIIS